MQGGVCYKEVQQVVYKMPCIVYRNIKVKLVVETVALCLYYTCAEFKLQKLKGRVLSNKLVARKKT